MACDGNAACFPADQCRATGAGPDAATRIPQKRYCRAAEVIGHVPGPGMLAAFDPTTKCDLVTRMDAQRPDHGTAAPGRTEKVLSGAGAGARQRCNDKLSAL